MKNKYTRKEVRAMADRWDEVIIRVGYCNLQYLLNDQYPFGYSTRAEGWACDYYDLGKIIVSTGYAPIGESVGYDLCRKYDQKAAKIWGNKWPYKRQLAQVKKLREKFVEDVMRSDEV